MLGSGAIEDFVLLADAHPTMRQLIVWQATEEVEHKAVAYDVLQATHPSYVLRVTGFLIATVSLFGWAIAGMRMLAKQDRISRKTFEAHRREALARNDNRGVTRIRAGIRAYLRRDFHPNDGPDRLPLARARLAEVMPGLA